MALRLAKSVRVSISRLPIRCYAVKATIHGKISALPLDSPLRRGFVGYTFSYQYFADLAQARKRGAEENANRDKRRGNHLLPPEEMRRILVNEWKIAAEEDKVLDAELNASLKQW